MHEFAIWAPRAGKLAVKLNDAILPMPGPDEEGWWRLSLNEAAAGTDYGFVIDDAPGVFPDPRSLWQPNGVHGPSRVYDQHAFGWTDTGFQPPPLSSAIVYE